MKQLMTLICLVATLPLFTVATDHAQAAGPVKQPPSYPSSYLPSYQDWEAWSEGAIKWAEEDCMTRPEECKKENDEGLDAWCLLFVGKAFMIASERAGRKEVKKAGWPTPLDAKTKLELGNAFYPADTDPPPRGALVFFSGEGQFSEDGHIGICLGGNTVIHAYAPDIKENSISDIEKLPGVGPYLGWSYPPEAWYGVSIPSYESPLPPDLPTRETFERGSIPSIYAIGVAVLGDYAYVANVCGPGGEMSGGLTIIDIDPPSSPSIVKSVDMPGQAMRVAVSGGYAYVAATTDGLRIFNIDPPSSAFVVQIVPTQGRATDVALSGGYAYVTDHEAGLHIIDIDPPESASIVKSVNTPGHAVGVAVLGGYAYVADSDGGLKIIDIDPPSEAYIVNGVGTPRYASGVAVLGGYAYVVDTQPGRGSGLQIIDIDPPESASLVMSVDVPGLAMRVAVSGGYAYVADDPTGLQIVDINLPSSAQVVKTVDTPGEAWDVTLSGGYAYVADGTAGLTIIKL